MRRIVTVTGRKIDLTQTHMVCVYDETQNRFRVVPSSEVNVGDIFYGIKTPELNDIGERMMSDKVAEVHDYELTLDDS